MKRVLVTGATGTLGAALVRALHQRGDHVTALSRTPEKLRRIGDLALAAYPYDVDGLRAAIAQGPVDAVMHVACAYGRSGESLADLARANFAVPLDLALAAGTKIGRWIAIGTSLPRQVSAYALTKHFFTEALASLSATALAPCEVIELEHFYGPGDDESKFLSRVTKACITGRPLDLTTGTQERDFIHVADAVTGLLCVLDSAPTPFRVVSLGSGEAITIRAVVERIHALSHSRSELRFGAVAVRANEPARCIADLACLRAMGWAPAMSLSQGLADLVHSEQQGQNITL